MTVSINFTVAGAGDLKCFVHFHKNLKVCMVTLLRRTIKNPYINLEHFYFCMCKQDNAIKGSSISATAITNSGYAEISLIIRQIKVPKHWYACGLKPVVS